MLPLVPPSSVVTKSLVFAMALLNFSLPFPSAPNFASEPYFNIPAPVTPPPLPSASEINSLFGPPQPPRRQGPPRRAAGPYRPPQQVTPPPRNYKRPTTPPQRGYPRQKPTPPPPPPTPAPTFSETGGGKGSHTLHAVIDYDDYDEVLTSNLPGGQNDNGVTPIQGPILLKNGSVPVVPLYSYPVLNNGSFVQIPVSEILLYFQVI